ncbi:GNAT family N-acetyltransferase [Actinomadura sp. LOL_016]|uniref:GNAT family N-acetyltransferase n=1 Tax=unclassified Actinomadura TaxID=2626254 RepID=UPI003A7F9A2E
MISMAWRRRLAGTELAEALELARVCTDFDRDAGFSRLSPAVVRGEGRHLLVRLDDSGGPLVGHLHLDEQSSGTIVVHPDHRSNGVATAVLETAELVGAHGWAEGHHPAAERLARRFGCVVTARIWRSARALTGPHATDPPSVAARVFEDPDPRSARTIWRASGLPERYRPPENGTARLLYAAGPDGPAGYAWLDRGTEIVDGLRTAALRAVVPAAAGSGTGLALAAGALARLRDEGAQAVEAGLDPALPRAVRLARLLGFQRTQDDVRYTLGSPHELR